jgi:hypothetical protein
VSRPRPRLAAGLVAATALLLAVAVVTAVATPGRPARDFVQGFAFVVPVVAFSVVGTVIARRRPENLIGWLLVTIGLLWAVVIASAFASTWALKTGSLPKAVGEWIDVPAYAWVAALGLLGTQLPLRVPDGELPSPRWRWFSRITLGLIAVAIVGMASTPGKVEGFAGTANPLGSHVLRWLSAAFLLVVVCFLGGLAAVIVRYRRSSVHDRVQLKWIAFGAAVFVAGYVVTYLIDIPLANNGAAGTANTAVSQMGFAALPIAIGYAVLKHHLYDIDTVVNRAVVYGTLTATLAAGYLGTVLLLQLVLSPSSDLAIAASTLAVAAVFRPARAQIQKTVDRRFYRRRYDAAQTLRRFSARLRDEVDLATLGAALQGVVAETMQPAHVSLWLRSPETRR